MLDLGASGGYTFALFLKYDRCIILHPKHASFSPIYFVELFFEESWIPTPVAGFQYSPLKSPGGKVYIPSPKLTWHHNPIRESSFPNFLGARWDFGEGSYLLTFTVHLIPTELIILFIPTDSYASYYKFWVYTLQETNISNIRKGKFNLQKWRLLRGYIGSMEGIYLKHRQNSCFYFWLVVSTHLNNISQIGNLPGPKIGMKIILKKHHLEIGLNKK